MKSKTVLIVNLILSAALLMAGLLLEPRFPEQMAVHWGADGNVNGYGSHFIGIWLLPLMVAGLTLLLMGLPYIDPKRKNIEQFRPFYNLFIFLFAIYMLYIHVLTLVWNLGYTFNFNTFIIPSFGFFTILIGQLLRHARQNYFIGIRTPWTLQDERVWNETHRQAGIVFMVSGVITLAGLLLPELAIWLLMIPLFVAAIYSIVLSYFLYRKYHPVNQE